MHILISNDDGYSARGIQALAKAMAKFGRVTVCAPEHNQSGASNSLTLQLPLRVTEVARDVYAVSGTPSDCVHLAFTGILNDRPDLVVSGINSGANMGDDTMYSGTSQRRSKATSSASIRSLFRRLTAAGWNLSLPRKSLRLW